MARKVRGECSRICRTNLAVYIGARALDVRPGSSRKARQKPRVDPSLTVLNPNTTFLSRSGIVYRGRLGETPIAVKVASGEATKHIIDHFVPASHTAEPPLNSTLFTPHPQARTRESIRIRPRASL